MDISLQAAIDHLKRWKTLRSELNIAVHGAGSQLSFHATVKALSPDMVWLAFSEAGDGLSVDLRLAKRFRSFLPAEPTPTDVGGSHKACLLFLVISLPGGSMCKVCELSDQANLPVILFSDTDNEVKAGTGQT